MADDGGQIMAQSPLAGVVVCCTSIPVEQRNALAVVVKQMGAEHKYDLTSDVTHLVIGNVDTPKYKFVAKERPDVKVVTPSWVEAVRESWMGGGDTDVAALEEEHRAATFLGLHICMTGFDDLAERNQLAESIANNGATYHGDLTKKITHLIAAEPTGKKYTYAMQWRIKVVSIEWFTDSIERGMVLDEELYQPTMAVEERGVGAWTRIVPEPTVPIKRQASQIADAAESNRRKLRRTASSKLEKQGEDIWAGITGGGQSRSESQDPEEGNHTEGRHIAKPRNRTSSGMVPSDAEKLPSALAVSVANASATLDRIPQAIFDGKSVYVHGFNKQKTAVIHGYLASHGALVIINAKHLGLLDQEAIKNGYVVFPHDQLPEKLDELPQGAENLKKVNDWWIETCISRKQFIEPSEDELSTPFKKMKITGMQLEAHVLS